MAKARFKGQCVCGHEFAAGASVQFERREGKLVVVECPTCQPDHHGAEHAPSATLTLRAKVEGVRFVKDDGTWTVISAALANVPEDAPSGTGSGFPVVGALGNKVQLGDLLEVTGNFQHNSKRGCWEFVVQRAVAVVAGTEQALRAFLARFPQVGMRRAELILQALGSREAVIHALEKDPSALTVVAGITEERAHAIAQAYRDLEGLRESALFLAELDLGEAATAQILDKYGADAKQAVVEDPYQLMELSGWGFKRADDLARRIKLDRDDPRRLAAAALYLLQQTTNEGHTYARLNDLMGVD